jgi:DnaK suppressor protein
VSKTPAQAPAKSASPAQTAAKNVVAVSKPAPKPVAKAAPAKTAPAKKAAVTSAPPKSTKPTPPAAPASKVPVKTTTKAVAAAPATKAPAAPARPSHGAAPTPSTASFSERFSPPKRSTQTYPEPMNAVKPAAKADPKLANAWKTKAGRELTDDELLAMPESEYMNEKQLEYFRTKLQTLKDDLLSNAGETTEHLREDTSIVPDPADRATIEEEHALELRTRDRERKLLKKISQSITRIDSGDYGYCDETGEPIGLGRLLARPTATLSLEAQQRRELKQKMFGD